MQLTDEQKEKYLEKSYVCPNCGGENLEGGSFEHNGTSVSQVIFCCSCDSSWADVFLLGAIECFELGGEE